MTGIPRVPQTIAAGAALTASPTRRHGSASASSDPLEPGAIG